MLFHNRFQYLVSTQYGIKDLKRKYIKDKSILDIFNDYENVGYWVYVNKGKIMKPHYNAGKWMLFIERENIEDCWNKLIKGMTAGVFKVMQCSIPNINNPHNVPNITAIMIFTDDYTDIEDVKRVLKFLLENGLDYGKELNYKADYQTRQRKYEGGRGISWVYSSNDFDMR